VRCRRLDRLGLGENRRTGVDGPGQAGDEVVAQPNQASVGGDAQREIAPEDVDPGQALAEIAMGEATSGAGGAIAEDRLVEVRGRQSQGRSVLAQVPKGEIQGVAPRYSEV
jgi:hypothetical protein